MKLYQVLLLSIVLSVSIPGVILLGGATPAIADSLSWHLKNYKPAKASPIDGVWKTPWGDRMIIDRGRMYNPDFDYPFTILKNIKQVAPGRYRAEDTGARQIPGKNITLSVVASTRLVIISDTTEVAYTRVKIKNSKWFMRDFDEAQKLAQTKKNEKSAAENKVPVAFHKIAVIPSKVARGEEFSLQALFTINNKAPSDQLIQASYDYEILSQDRVLFKSKIKMIGVENHHRTPLEIKLRASSREGDYCLKLNVSQPEGSLTADADFSIVSPEIAQKSASTPETVRPGDTVPENEKILGKWRVVFPSGPTGDTVTFLRQNSKLTARVVSKTARTEWVKVIEKEDSIILRCKQISHTEGCWYEVEDTISLNEEMKILPVRSKILDGGYCVSIGQIFKSTLQR